jgi:hypothetical protein
MSETATTGPAVTGRLLSQDGPLIVLKIPGSDYQLHLVPSGELTPDARGDVTGLIRCRAKRVDVVGSGGRFLEPVMGRPRRIQGRVIGGDLKTNSLTIHAGGAVVIATLTDPRQQAADFALNQMVTFGVERGATFEPTPQPGS